MRSLRFLLVLIFLGFGISALSGKPPGKQAESANRGKSNQEAGLSHDYKKWLDEDALYIISNEERSVFKSLINDKERESFIEQFWNRRNPESNASYNSFKEEHYRRIAYANEHYASGFPGWKSDRGRIYIIYGKPDELDTHPTGGAYERPYGEGGGTTTTLPFEKWWYRHIDGVGERVELEFVDSSMNGEYRLAISPDEKDALVNVPNTGLTLAEQIGLYKKRDRVYFIPGGFIYPDSLSNTGSGIRMDPFGRMERHITMLRPPIIKFKDLKTAVDIHASYSGLTYDLRADFLKLTPERALVPITIELNNSELEFKREQDFNRAKVNLYGRVTTLTQKIVAEWEDEIIRDFNDILFPIGKNRQSEYQKIVALAPGQPYKLELVLKDGNSEKMGTMKKGLNIPKYDDSALQSSAIILANHIALAPANAAQLDPYVIGDLRIMPRMKHEYTTNQNLVPYMQIYNMQVDQTSYKLLPDVTFLLKSSSGNIVEEIKTTAFNSAQLFYRQRTVLLGKIPLKGIPPGKYILEIKVQDTVANRSLSASTDFKVTG
jgi:GWxTD domain-containing protein